MNAIFRAICITLATIFLQSAKGKDIEPDQPIFAAISGAVDSNTEVDRQKYLTALLNGAGPHYEKLIPQLLVYERQAQDMKHGMAAGLVVSLLQIPSADIVSAMLPYLDTTNTIQRDQIRNWLMGMDEGPAGSKPNFRDYEFLMKSNSAMDNKSLILYMFDRDPQTAVISIAKVCGQEVPESEVADKAQSGEKEAVDYFAERSEWWAHLYVVKMMEEAPHLRTPELLEILEKDTNSIVQEEVSRLREEMLPGDGALPMKE